jgi:hypothetical protein
MTTPLRRTGTRASPRKGYDDEVLVRLEEILLLDAGARITILASPSAESCWLAWFSWLMLSTSLVRLYSSGLMCAHELQCESDAYIRGLWTPW